MLKKIMAMACALCLTTAVFTSCGDTSEGGSSEAATTTTKAAESAAEEASSEEAAAAESAKDFNREFDLAITGGTLPQNHPVPAVAKWTDLALAFLAAVL